MTQTIAVTYEHGVFVPRIPVNKVESCTAFFQLLFTRRIKSVVATITLLELAAILTAAGHYVHSN